MKILRGTPPNRRGRRLAAAAALVALVMGGVAPNPARAAAPPTEDTWVGQVEMHVDHDDYVGRPCPEGPEICAAYVAHYRIVALNPAARQAVARLAGGQARLHGRLEPSQQPGHNATLLVRRAERQTPASPTTVLVGDDASGTTVHLAPGDHLKVVLHSISWTFDAPSAKPVISANGAAVYAAGPMCPATPGRRCGTVTIRYTAHEAGSAVISAHRSTPAQSRWAVRIVVG